MKKHLLLLIFTIFLGTLGISAQSVAKYGYLSRKAILEALPETTAARLQLDTLRAKYEAETHYNETEFRRQFSEFLQSQKGLPEPILLKRQSDLQTLMERSLAFRREAEILLKKAETDLFAPINTKVDAAIRVVGSERGYDCIIDTDAGSMPYFNPALSEDATSFVKAKLNTHR